MKTRYYTLFVLSALALIACNKEETQDETPEVAGKTITLKGIYTDVLEAKSHYNLVGDTYQFQWVAGDKFLAQTYDGSSTYSGDTFAADTGGSASSDFTGTVSDGYSLQTYAFYPNAGDGKTSYTNNFVYKNVAITPVAVDADVSAETATVTLAGTITEDINHPMANIPMIGVNDGTGSYSFSAATGVLKITIEDLPIAANSIRLDIVSGSYALNGSFVFDTNYEIKDAYCIGSKWGQKYMNITAGTDSNGDGITDAPRSFYFPIPTGTIAAEALEISIYNGSTKLDSRVSKKAITLTRGRVTEVPAISARYIRAVVSGTSTATSVQFYFDTSRLDEVRYGTAQNWYDSYATNAVTTPGTSINISSNSSIARTLGYVGYKNGVAVTGVQKITYYPISSSDSERLVGTYSCVVNAGTPPVLRFKVSDNPLKGAIMMRDFYETDNHVANIYGTISGDAITFARQLFKQDANYDYYFEPLNAGYSGYYYTSAVFNISTVDSKTTLTLSGVAYLEDAKYNKGTNGYISSPASYTSLVATRTSSEVPSWD